MTIDLEENLEEELRFNWVRPYFMHGSEPFHPKIANNLGFNDHADSNCVSISLNCRQTSDLNWKAAKQQAEQAAAGNKKIFWELDLGLFGDLENSLECEVQYKALSLALDHFRATLWKDFHKATFGASLYKGPANYAESFYWNRKSIENFQGWLSDHFADIQELENETGLLIGDYKNCTPELFNASPKGIFLLEQFCRTACITYLEMLLGSLPDALLPFVCLDTNLLQSPLQFHLATHSEIYERFCLALTHSPIPHYGLNWDKEGYSQNCSNEPLQTAVCIPPANCCKPSQAARLEHAFMQLAANSIAYRTIAENQLTAEWDGVDYLIICPSLITSSGKRKLQGFCAAGGTVVLAEDGSMHLPGEMTFSDFFINKGRA